MAKLTRRDFLRRGIGYGCTMSGGSMLAGCGAFPDLAPPVPVTPTTARATVAVIRGQDLDRMAREALAAVGGAEAIVHEGETVFIKPNFGGAGMVHHNHIRDGDSTKPEIVVAVAEECLKAGAAEVIIGEAAQVPTFSWDELQTLDGSTSLAAEAQRLNDTYAGRVTLSCLSGESPAWDAVPSPYSGLGEIKISSHVARADRIISIPVIKTHRWTQVTGALKNFVGVTSVEQYGSMQWRYKLHDSPAGIEQCFLDIVSAIKPDLTIVDGSICCEGNGPHVLAGWWGSTVNMRDRLGDWLLLASTDLAAADATAARIIRHDVAGISHLQKAYNQGLGQIQQDLIDVVGADLGSLCVDWQPAEPTDGFWDILIPGIKLTTGK